MGLIEQAKKDIEQITSNSNDFGVTMLFEAPGGEKATVNGLHSKHHMAYDTDGNMVNSQNAHVSVSEKFLTDAGYPGRNLNGEVTHKDHKVTVKDSTGVEKVYSIREWYPDETIGLITCILGIYGTT